MRLSKARALSFPRALPASELRRVSENPGLSLLFNNLLKDQRLTTGRTGETLARRYLENKGFKILDQNYRTKYGEIDLIGKDKNDLVFIEVRTKTKEDFGMPEETLNFKKITKLRKNALAYTAKINWKGPIRLDALCLILDQKNQPKRIDHYENIC